MKRIVLFSTILIAANVFACNDQLLHLALNQRSFYNPAALCPYCKGSPFFSLGYNFFPALRTSGYLFAAGDDGENKVHGPWDIAFSRSVDPSSATNAYGLRYAWRQHIGRQWSVAAGFRIALLDYSQKFSVSENNSAVYHTSVMDGDVGAMVTNKKGFYSGISVQHVFEPGVKISSGNHVISSSVTVRNYEVTGGGIIPLGYNWDIMADGSAIAEGENVFAEPSAILRYEGVAGIGGGVYMATGSAPQYELRGGVTTSLFKWLGTVAFTPEGKVFETGMVYRFGPVQPCTGGACKAVKTRTRKHHHGVPKDEFAPHL